MTCITLRPALLPAITLAILTTASAAFAQESGRPGLPRQHFRRQRARVAFAAAGPARAAAGRAGPGLGTGRAHRIASKRRSASSPARSNNCSIAISSLKRELHDAARRSAAARAGASGRLSRRRSAAAARRRDGAATCSIPLQHPNAPGVPHTLGSTTTSVRAGAAARIRGDAVGAPGGRQAGAPLDLSTLAGTAVTDPSLGPGTVAPRRRAAAYARPRGSSPSSPQVATLPPSDSPKDNYDLAYGYVLRRDYALAEDGFRAFLQKFPERSAHARRAILAGREPVPAPAISRGGGGLPDRLDEIRNQRARRPTRCCGSASRLRRWARRKPPAPRSAKSCANIRARRSRSSRASTGNRSVSAADGGADLRRRSEDAVRRPCSIPRSRPCGLRWSGFHRAARARGALARRAQARAAASRGDDRSWPAAGIRARGARGEAARRPARRAPSHAALERAQARRPDCRRPRATCAIACSPPPRAAPARATSSPPTRSTTRPRPC